MAVLPILTVPDPRLSQKARPVAPEEFGPALESFTRDMAETMYAAPGVGLAAPQVGDLRRILVADPSQDSEGEKRGAAYIVMVNPEVLERSREKYRYEEGCLSVPEFYEEFERPKRIRVRWQDALGQVFERVFEDYPAVVVQHEMDHLEGITLIDKVSMFRRSRYLRARRRARTE